MKHNIIYLVALLVLGSVVLTGCYEDEVESVVSPVGTKSIVTISGVEDFTFKSEDDTIWYEISVDKPVQHEIAFDVIFDTTSTATEDDFEIIGGVLAPYATSTLIGIIVLGDHEDDGAIESLKFAINSDDDYAWNWQLDLETSVPFSSEVTLRDYNYSLEWDFATAADSATGDLYGMCDWGVDFDMYIGNADFSVYDIGGATAACPEFGSFPAFPAGDYDIYVDMWSIGDLDTAMIADTVNFEMPYVATIYNQDGDDFVYEGSYMYTTPAESSTVIGSMTKNEDGTLTVTFN